MNGSGLALSDAEKVAVSNTDRLTQKIADLTAAMGKGELNFELSYNDYFKTPDTPDIPDTPDTPDEPNTGSDEESGLPGWAIALIVIGAVLVAGGAAFGVVYFLKLKKGSAVPAADARGTEQAPDVTENNETEENTENGEENKEE